MRSFSIEHFGKRGHMGSTFSKRVRNFGFRPSAEKSGNCGNRTSARGIGHLLVQNPLQEVQEYFGHKEKAKRQHKK